MWKGRVGSNVVGRLCALGFTVLGLAVTPRSVSAYGPLTHEAIVDAAWDTGIVPLLRRRYAGVTEDELREAHAYAYGGCIIQDMGYYPFGRLFFTDLAHYVRTGDFTATLLEEAQPIEEYAFALGALEHYLADSIGHPMGVNPAVAIAYPNLGKRYGPEVTWDDDPTAHLKVEFAFDVLQMARGPNSEEAYHDLIGFKVAKSLLERAFFKTYGLDLRELFADEDLAIETYRHAVSEVVPLATEVAWEMKKDDIELANPGIRREQFVYSLPLSRYQREWGTRYKQPGWFAKVLSWVMRPLSKVPPIDVFDIPPPQPEMERLFLTSSAATVDAYRAALARLGRRELGLPNKNLDTGALTRAGDYPVADDTYAELLDKLSTRYFATVEPGLRANMLAFYGPPIRPYATKDHKWRKLLERVVALKDTQDSFTDVKTAGMSSGK